MRTRYASGRRQGINEELVAQLADYEQGPFSEREKAALRYADQMYLDHHDVTDEFFAALREHFDEAEVVELSWAIVEFIAVGKLIYVFGIPYEEAEGAALAGVGHSHEESAE